MKKALRSLMNIFGYIVSSLTILAMVGGVTYGMYTLGGTALAVIVGSISLIVIAGFGSISISDGPFATLLGILAIGGCFLLILAIPFGAFLAFLPTYGISVAIVVGIATLIGIILLLLLLKWAGNAGHMWW